ncbi:MAG: cysteine--tRNA ligase [Gemmatimonadota bacterium]|nr:cysteine--tRNA ligase [Gemmatimonadota bacterium]
MSDFRLYNTLTRRVEPFAPADGQTARIYTCGPTVYNPAHLGNFRTFLFNDLLRRTLRLRGWKVHQVQNLTDVDDKIIRRAHELGKTIREITAEPTRVFFEDRDWLRIEPAESYPKATEYIPQQIALVERLLERGIAYRADDGSVYFAIDRFPGYGKLSQLDRRELKAGARVAQDDYSKENAQDFALWKAVKPEDERTGAAWDSPFGRGRPGWHLECSAMAMELLGVTLDIHCGGIDLIFPHHEDEIAQSEGATGQPFSRFWCHGAFLLTEGTKMAKRVGNVFTVQALREAGYTAAAVRHFVFMAHYRKELNLTDEALDASMSAVRRVGELADRLRSEAGGTPELAAAADELERDAKAALFDDLNAPEASAALFSFVRKANAELDRAGTDSTAIERARDAFRTVATAVLDVVPAVVGGSVSGAASGGDAGGDRARLTEWVEERLRARQEARARRDFGVADAIRAELEGRGIEVKDTAGGTTWRTIA